MRFGSNLAPRALSLKAAANNVIQSVFAGKKGSGATTVELVSGTSWYNPPPANSRALLTLYNENPWVRSILSKVGKSVAKQCWYLETKAGERIEDHPALKFLRTGTGKIQGKRMTGKRSFMLTTLYMDLVGEAAWAIGRGPDGKPASYGVVPPHWITDTPSQTGTFYNITPKNGGLVSIPAEEMLMFSEPDVLDPFGRGRGATAAAKVEIDADESAAAYIAGYWKNNARPDLIITGTEANPLNQDDVGRMERTFVEKFRGVAKKGRSFFSASPINIQEIGSGLRENNAADIREQGRKIIAEFYNIPPELVGRLESSNRATIDAADYIYAEHIITVRLDALQDELTPFLDEEFGLEEAGLKLCYESPTKEDVTQKLAVMTAAPREFFKGNEWRALAGEKPDPSLDVLYVPPAMPDPFGFGGGSGSGKPPMDDAEDPTEEAAKDEEPEPAKIAATAVRKSLATDDIVKVSSAHLDPQVVAQATAIMQKTFEKLLRTYGEELLAELESDVNFQINMRTADWLLQRGSAVLGRVDATTQAALQKALETGVANNEALDALMARVDQLFADAAEVRGVLIGQTEATALTGFGSLEGARQGGFERKTWISTRDQVVRDSHRELDGQIVPTNEPFRAQSGAAAMHPGAFGSAAEDINCRCAMRPILDGEKGMQSRFENLHTRQWQTCGRGVQRAMESILMAQAAVVKTQLQRTMGDFKV